jgi:integration host factor subunit alpha
MSGESSKTAKTITRADLVEAIVRRTGVPRAEAGKFLESMLERIGDALVNGDAVKLARFGNFQARRKRERVGRNPKTGAEVPITPRRVVTFRPSPLLRERVEKGQPKQARRKGVDPD